MSQRSTVDALAIRRRLGRQGWNAPVPFGPDGFRFDSQPGWSEARIIALHLWGRPDGCAVLPNFGALGSI